MQVFFAKDIHKLKKKSNSTIFLGGIKLKNQEYQIIAHSDGDLIIHALTSCILACVGSQTLGEIFPDYDNENKNKSSLFFLAYALTALKKQNKKINNIDITIVCEQILLKDYHNLIINKITELTNCKNVSIKSTRFENKRNKYIECNCLITI